MAMSDRIPTPKRLLEIRRSLPMDAGNVEFGVAVAREALKSDRARAGIALRRAVEKERERCAKIPLTRDQIDDVMTEHYPLDSLLRENVDAFEACVRDIERRLGIGA